MKTLEKALDLKQYLNTNVGLICDEKTPISNIKYGEGSISVNDFINQNNGDSGISIIDNSTLMEIIGMAYNNKFRYEGRTFRSLARESLHKLEKDIKTNDNMSNIDIINAMRQMADELADKAHISDVISAFVNHRKQLAFEAQVSSIEE